MKKITTQWLNSIGACKEGIEWVESLNTNDPIKIIEIAIKSKDLTLMNYCNWGISRMLNREELIRYAAYAAEMAVPIWEKQHPDNNRPQKAIAAAKEVIKNDNEKNRDAAATAADDLFKLGYVAKTAAAYIAAAYATAYIAAHADYTACAAAAYAACILANGGSTKTLIKCLKYGIKLLEKK